MEKIIYPILFLKERRHKINFDIKKITAKLLILFNNVINKKKLPLIKKQF